jgi:hypothetical protein
VILGRGKVQVDKMGVFYFPQNKANQNDINTFTSSSQADIGAAGEQPIRNRLDVR